MAVFPLGNLISDIVTNVKAWIINGTAAHDDPATGNPLQIGGVYRVADPALSDGDAGSIRVNSKGEVLTQLTGRTTTKTATIANGASLSGEVNIEDYQFIAIKMPADWTPANLTFQASNVSGGTFYDVYNDAGDEITALAAATRIITIDVNSLGLAPLSFIKIRSGTSATAVAQGAERTLTLILKK